EMFRALEKGHLKAIWIAGTNPAVSLPDLHHVRRALARASLVVVQDAYHPTETTELADFVLPAAQWGEKEWTSTNSERMVAYSPNRGEARGEALPDWEILARFARRLGFSGFDWASAAEVWDEFAGLTAGRPCDMAGITAARLRAQTSLQWPCPTTDHPGTKRRYQDGVFPTSARRAAFPPRPPPAHPRPPQHRPPHHFPFGPPPARLPAPGPPWRPPGRGETGARRGRGPLVEVTPADAGRLGVKEGDLVQLSSRRGTIRLPA